MAETAINAAPGVLAVKADYQSGRVTIGTETGQAISRGDIISSLKSIGYKGEFSDESN